LPETIQAIRQPPFLTYWPPTSMSSAAIHILYFEGFGAPARRWAGLV
jgi:hypothetical protein